MLEVGQTAPAFELADADMILVPLAEFHRIHNVVLYQYPENDTPGS